MPDIIRHKKVSLNDLQEGDYVINEFGGQIKGVLKLNGKLHSSVFEQESNKSPLKSEQNDIVINDGMSDRVIIGDIGKTRDGKLFGIKVSTPGHNARFAPKTNLLLDSSTSIDFSYKIIAHNMTDEIDTSEVFLPWFGITEAADLTGVSSSFLAVNKSDFDNIPKFEIGDNCGISVQSALDYTSGSSADIQWKVTSVWEVEVVL